MADADALASIRQELAKLPPIPEMPPKQEKKGFFQRLFKKKNDNSEDHFNPKLESNIVESNMEDFLSKLKQEDLLALKEGEAKRSGTSLPAKGPLDDDFIEAMPEPLMQLENDKLSQIEEDLQKNLGHEDTKAIPPALNTDLRYMEASISRPVMDTGLEPEKTPEPKQPEITEKPVKNWKQLKMREKRLLQKERMLIKRATIIEARSKKIDEKIKRIEKDKQEIDAREQEIVELVASLEKDRETIDQRIEALHNIEQSIKQKKDEIDKLDHQVSARELELKDTERRLRDTEKDIADQRAALAKEAIELDRKREICKAEMDKLEDIKKRLADIEQREKRLSEREQSIKQAAQELERFKAMKADIKRMEETHQRLKERLSEDWKKLSSIHQKASEQPENSLSVAVEPVKQSESRAAAPLKIAVSDVNDTIVKVRELINARQFDAASVEVRKLMDFYTSIPDSYAEKRQIYYSILGLRNELKLSEL